MVDPHRALIGRLIEERKSLLEREKTLLGRSAAMISRRVN